MTNILELFLPIFCFGNLLFITMIADQEAQEQILGLENSGSGLIK